MDEIVPQTTEAGGADAPGPDGTYDLAQIRDRELSGHVLVRRPRPGLDQARRPSDQAFELKLAGLSLSGGGVRSACFNLGLLQALGRKRVLEDMDYLSTVSGGGYIGSCLTALCSGPGAGVTPENFPFRFDGTKETEPVQHVRRHGNFLALRFGLLRLDTWRLLSTYLGGLVITVITVAVLLAGTGAVLQLATNAFDDWFWRSKDSAAPAWLLFAPALACCGLWALAGLLYELATVWPLLWNIGFRRWLMRTQGRLLRGAAVLALLACVPLLMQLIDGWLSAPPPEAGVDLEAWVHARLVSAGWLGAAAASLLSSALLKGAVAKLAMRARKLLLQIGAALAVAFLVLAILYLVWRLQTWAWTILAWAVGLTALGAVAVDINRVSMFYFYRDRLSEAFVFRRRATPRPAGEQDEIFSDEPWLESADKLQMHDVVGPSGPRAPYHLVNTCLNLAGSEDVWRAGRKADLFVISRFFCGADATGWVRTEDWEAPRVSLATAMAVSGAAANPQAGSHTHPADAFLMSLLNLRLGVWVRNPARLAALASGRLSSLHAWVARRWPVLFVCELLSRSREDTAYVHLSDGGHVENLGVFELLRRECELIVCSDAGLDPRCELDDLLALMRRARIDLGIEIVLPDLKELAPDETTGLGKRHAISGTIRYPDRPPEPEGPGRPARPAQTGRTGRFVYVKSALLADDPPDLHDYRRRYRDFPHQTTGDQFFDEGQFESYRELGWRSGVQAAELLGAAPPTPRA